ncbi:MAG: hypothetical protein IT456_26065 [Planctomycetes bacterium]|nr:hypothetical protein [Planctomycetota bacterium]
MHESGKNVLLASLTLLASCALQWQDGNGVTHSLGTVLVTERALLAGTRIERWAFGIDLRLSGPEPGVTLGCSIVQSTKPALHQVEPSGLGAAVYEFLTLPCEPKAPVPAVHRFFVAGEDASDDATMVESSCLGFEIGGRHGKAMDITLGYRASSYYCGAAFLPGIVQIHSFENDAPHDEALNMWVLTSVPNGVSKP